LDAVRDYPAPGEWFRGLLLVDPTYRQEGVGSKLYQAFEGWAMQRGAQHIGLGVVEQNKRAYVFWQRLDFEEQEKRPPRRYGNKEHVVIVMIRRLSSDMLPYP
jgi:ribosomal protein S18 acetylase RimI-like enzyme